MTISEFNTNYLNHYLLLEQDFKATINYVTPDENNFTTYSIAYLKLLLTIGSEVDIMLEFLSRLYDPTSTASGFGCSKIIANHEPEIQSLEVSVNNKSFSLLPWKGNPIPDWWTAYNEIKHNRYESAIKFDSSRKYYQYANLQNVLNALAALLSLELYAYRLIALNEGIQPFVPTIKSIFTINSSHWKDCEFGNGMVFCDDCLYLDS